MASRSATVTRAAGAAAWGLARLVGLVGADPLIFIAGLADQLWLWFLAAYVGFLQLSLQLQQPRLHHDEFEAYVEHVMDTLIPQT